MKENKMGVMPVNRLLVTMAAPMILSMLIGALYNVVDSLFVSHFRWHFPSRISSLRLERA
jgi:Na+-driven multidrug efflux pump